MKAGEQSPPSEALRDRANCRSPTSRQSADAKINGAFRDASERMNADQNANAAIKNLIHRAPRSIDPRQTSVNAGLTSTDPAARRAIADSRGDFLSVVCLIPGESGINLSGRRKIAGLHAINPQRTPINPLPTGNNTTRSGN